MIKAIVKTKNSNSVDEIANHPTLTSARGKNHRITKKKQFKLFFSILIISSAKKQLAKHGPVLHRQTALQNRPVGRAGHLGQRVRSLVAVQWSNDLAHAKDQSAPGQK